MKSIPIAVTGILLALATAPSFADTRVASFPVTADDRERLSGHDSSRIEAEIEAAVAPAIRGMKSIRRRMSPVRDQGGRGTCSAFAAAALFEFALGGNYDVSEQCLVAFGSERDSGWISQRIGDALRTGLFLEKSCAYSTNTVTAPFSVKRNQPELLFDNNFFYMGRPNLSSLQTVKRQIDRDAPVGLSLWVSTNAWFDRSPIIAHPAAGDNLCQSSECGGHAIVITGYDDFEQTLEIKNSWGTDWKDGGYGYITYEYFLKNYMSGRDNELVSIQ